MSNSFEFGPRPYFDSTKSMFFTRNQALRVNYIMQNLIAVVCVIWGMSVPVMTILTFGSYVLMGNTLDAAKVCTV